MKVALVQLGVRPGAVERNRDRAVDAIAAAADQGADLVALPELFTVGFFAFDAYARHAEPLDGPTVDRLGRAAVTNDVAVLAGSFVEDLAASASAGAAVPDPAGLANTAVLLDAAGERRAVYRKQHLFGYGSREAELLVPGERLPTAEIEGVTVAIVTCYDLRFPRLFRELGPRAVDLLLVPSAWPYPRVEHWRLFTRTRAVENLWYLAAINGVGEFEAGTLVGRSALVGPWGTTVAGAGDEPTTITGTVDPDRVAAVREEFPAVADRRPE